MSFVETLDQKTKGFLMIGYTELIYLMCIYFSIVEYNNTCIISIEPFEEKDEGIWGCELKYQNKEGESVEYNANWNLHMANFSDETPTLEELVVDENTTETNFM